ncbi:MAG: ABC transporter ATP-binding protein [Xanthomonadales bacterium]|nr:ABC transporter ATP-binding protein [Xanthomonadales bacterium]
MSRLACRNLDLSIGGKQVVSGLELELAPGQFWGLMGANGIGKTTLMKCLAGLVPPDHGRVELDGHTLAGMPRRAVAKSIGMMQQHTVYVFDASVLQTALTGRHPHLGQWQRESADDLQRAREAIAEVGLAGMEERSVTSLSGGEARRLAFASLRVQDPGVMLLDEPSNHLDLKHQVLIMSTIGDAVYSGQRTAVAATHDVNLAACYCSHVLMLFGDGDWSAGPAPQMFRREALERLYQCPVEMVETPAGMRFHPSFDSRST